MRTALWSILCLKYTLLGFFVARWKAFLPWVCFGSTINRKINELKKKCKEKLHGFLFLLFFFYYFSHSFAPQSLYQHHHSPLTKYLSHIVFIAQHTYNAERLYLFLLLWIYSILWYAIHKTRCIYSQFRSLSLKVSIA